MLSANDLFQAVSNSRAKGGQSEALCQNRNWKELSRVSQRESKTRARIEISSCLSCNRRVYTHLVHVDGTLPIRISLEMEVTHSDLAKVTRVVAIEICTQMMLFQDGEIL